VAEELPERAGGGARALLRVGPHLRLDHPLPQRPRDDRDHEQLGEQDPRHPLAQVQQHDPEQQRRDRPDVRPPAEIAFELIAPSSETKSSPKPNCFAHNGNATAPATIDSASM